VGSIPTGPTRYMKQYHSIGKDNIKGKPFYCFDKLDGSNIRSEWNPKRGFSKFGSRTQLIDQSSPLGKLSIPLIKNQEDIFDQIFRKTRVQEATCFFELFGPSSFAGVHKWDEQGFQVVLFDVSLYKQGLMPPKQFLEAFGGIVPIPNLVHVGNVTDSFEQDVWNGMVPGVTFEGVVCKGAPLKNGYPPHMFKLKSQRWVDKVKSLYTDPKILESLL
jgi:hypothetical protein